MSDNDVLLSVRILSFNLPLLKLIKIKHYEEDGLYYTTYS